MISLILKPVPRASAEIIRLQPGQSCTLGASPAADFCLDSAGIAPIHCRISCRNRFGFIEGLDADSKVIVNGEAFNRSRIVNEDKLRIGLIEFVVVTTAETKPPKFKTPIDMDELFDSEASDTTADPAARSNNANNHPATKQEPDSITIEELGFDDDFLNLTDPSQSSSRFDDLEDDFYAIDDPSALTTGTPLGPKGFVFDDSALDDSTLGDFTLDENDLGELPSTADVMDVSEMRALLALREGPEEKQKNQPSKRDSATSISPATKHDVPFEQDVESAEDINANDDKEEEDDNAADEKKAHPIEAIEEPLATDKFVRQQSLAACELAKQTLNRESNNVYQPEKGYLRRLIDFNLETDQTWPDGGAVLIISPLDESEINRFVADKRWHDRLRFPLGLQRFLELAPPVMVAELFDHISMCLIVSNNRKDWECYRRGDA